MATSGKRAFWMHQAAEYLIGAAFVASGLQSPTPMVPTLMGGLIMINTACSKGPLSAFNVFPKRTHRVLDAALVLLSLAAALQPFVAIDGGTRGIMVLLAVCMGMIWLQSDFAERPERERHRSTSATSATGSPPTTGAAATSSTEAGSGATGSGATGSGATGSAAPSVGSFTDRRSPAAQPDGSTADTIGRTAGRLAGKGVKMYRARKANQKPNR